ncbi:MAG: hypothetical protein U0931_04060 [Vulcanimicrobiota bacterium]
MEIKKAGVAAQPTKPLAASQPQPQAAAAPTDQVAVGQASPQDQAIAVMQQMAQARVELGHQLITQVLEPAPKEFQEVGQATMAAREEVAKFVASTAEGSENPSQQGVLSAAFYVLATETATLAEAAVRAESRAEFQEKEGAKADRDGLFREELGYLIEGNIYQGQIPPDQIQNLVAGLPAPQGDKAFSAGAPILELRKYVPAELSQQVTQAAEHNPLVLAFNSNPELQKRFTGALQQNFEAAKTVSGGCLQYFNVLGQIVQQDLAAQQVLAEAQAQQNQA